MIVFDIATEVKEDRLLYCVEAVQFLEADRDMQLTALLMLPRNICSRLDMNVGLRSEVLQGKRRPKVHHETTNKSNTVITL